MPFNKLVSPIVLVDATSILLNEPFEIYELEVGFESVIEHIRFLDHEFFELVVLELLEHAKLVS